jgi:hypothetical protein
LSARSELEDGERNARLDPLHARKPLISIAITPFNGISDPVLDRYAIM